MNRPADARSSRCNLRETLASSKCTPGSARRLSLVRGFAHRTDENSSAGCACPSFSSRSQILESVRGTAPHLAGTPHVDRRTAHGQHFRARLARLCRVRCSSIRRFIPPAPRRSAARLSASQGYGWQAQTRDLPYSPESPLSRVSAPPRPLFRLRVLAAFFADADRSAAEREAAAAPPIRPPFFAGYIVIRNVAPAA